MPEFYTMMSALSKALAIAICLLAVPATHAKERFQCGEYAISGIIKKHADHFVVKLYEETMSEVILSLPQDLEGAAEIYENRAVTINAKMVAPIKNRRGEAQSLMSATEVKALLAADQPYSARYFREDLKERVPDPLHPDQDSGLVLLKELPCKN